MSDVRTLPAGEDNEEIRVTLDDLAREGARRMIAATTTGAVIASSRRSAGMKRSGPDADRWRSRFM